MLLILVMDIVIIVIIVIVIFGGSDRDNRMFAVFDAWRRGLQYSWFGTVITIAEINAA